jgi:hypothetical protein
MNRGGANMIVDLLPRGKENAISTEALLQASGATSVRELRKMVANERKAGEIIASSNSGYFMPADLKEIEEFVRTLDSKARSIMVALQSARKLLKTAVDEDQMVLQSCNFSQNWQDKGVM